MTNSYHAFPSPGVVLTSTPNERQQGAYEGMTLREHYAGQAMLGLLVDGRFVPDEDAEHRQLIAKTAVLMADELIKTLAE